ncbi:type III-A CRISPR-associated protein Csm2 [Thermovibrio sp.]
MNRSPNSLRVSVKGIVDSFFSGKPEGLKRVLLDSGNGKSLLEEFARALGNSKVSFTKVRKYYETFLKLYRETLKEDEDKSLSPAHTVKLYLLRSRVVYDSSREKGLKLFVDFITELVKRVNTYKDLRRAKELFEAFVGYAKGELKD